MFSVVTYIYVHDGDNWCGLPSLLLTSDAARCKVGPYIVRALLCKNFLPIGLQIGWRHFDLYQQYPITQHVRIAFRTCTTL